MAARLEVEAAYRERRSVGFERPADPLGGPANSDRTPEGIDPVPALRSGSSA
jgi:hypothetical protein